VRGFLIEFFATAMLVAVIGLAGAGHGRLRRFLALQAMVAFMVLSTHMISWAFMFAPNDWTAVLVFDSWVGLTLAGLPAVFLMRGMREGDTSAA
jgi:glycerol uptake facilitator-like aquaporin